MISLLPFAGYFVGLAVPLFALKDYWAQFSDQTAQAVTIGQIISLASLLFFRFMNFGRGRHPISYKALLFAAPFTGWCVVSIVWSISPSTTIVNNVLFGLYISTLLAMWQLPLRDFKRLSLIGACSMMAVMLPLPFVLQIRDRTLGGIQPNLIGAYAFLIMVLFLLHGRWKLWPALIAAFIIYFTQARTIFIGFVIFWAVWLLLSNYLHLARNRINLLMPVVPVGVVVGYFYYNYRDYLIDVVSKALNVTASSRLGSDYTGRADVWEVAAAKIAGRPLQGYGFRTRETADLTYITDSINGHSGVLNILLDVGYIGLALFALWYFFAFWKAIDPRPHPMFPQRIVIAAFLVGNIPILALEPNYISFANPTAFLTLLAFAFPLADLEASPARQPRARARGNPVRRQRYSRV